MRSSSRFEGLLDDDRRRIGGESDILKANESPPMNSKSVLYYPEADPTIPARIAGVGSLA
jgi:hypothetical protein